VEHCFRPEQKAIENGELCLIVLNSTEPDPNSPHGNKAVWNVRYLVTKVGEVGGGTICSQSVLVITTYNKTFSPNQIHKLATGEGGG